MKLQAIKMCCSTKWKCLMFG